MKDTDEIIDGILLQRDTARVWARRWRQAFMVATRSTMRAVKPGSPVCDKALFVNELEARLAGMYFGQTYGKRFSVYPCSDCSGWHLTKGNGKGKGKGVAAATAANPDRLRKLLAKRRPAASKFDESCA